MNYSNAERATVLEVRGRRPRISPSKQCTFCKGKGKVPNPFSGRYAGRKEFTLPDAICPVCDGNKRI